MFAEFANETGGSNTADAVTDDDDVRHPLVSCATLWIPPIDQVPIDEDALPLSSVDALCTG